jgi:hypothetical protein
MTDSDISLTTVFHGSIAEALQVQSLLQSYQMVAHVDDANTKSIYPFITGGNIFLARVSVRAADAERALRVLRQSEPVNDTGDGGEAVCDGDAASVAPDSPGTVLAERELTSSVEVLGRRLRWAAVLSFFGLPLVLVPVVILVGFLVYCYYFSVYLRRVVAEPKRPDAYSLTIGAFGMMIALAALATYSAVIIYGYDASVR